jgi:hypothetical protein
MIVARREIKILGMIEPVTDGTISMIQSTTDDSVKKQLINQYCGRLSTWEASWMNALKEGSDVLEVPNKHSEHSFSADRGSDLINLPMQFSPLTVHLCS